MAVMASNRGRIFQGQTQVVIFRNTGGECVWQEIGEARRTVARLPAEWSKEPFAGQTYGTAKDPDVVEVYRHGTNGASPLERPSDW